MVVLKVPEKKNIKASWKVLSDKKIMATKLNLNLVSWLKLGDGNGL
jgi:hypothetical protein